MAEACALSAKKCMSFAKKRFWLILFRQRDFFVIKFWLYKLGRLAVLIDSFPFVNKNSFT